MSDAADADMREIRGILGRLEPVLVRTDERLRAIETDMARLHERMSGMSDRMNGMATQADLARVEGTLRADMASLEGRLVADLATKPSRGSMWAMAIALVGLVVASIGAGAAFLPLVSRALHQ